MDKVYQTLEYNVIIEKLAEYAVTEQARDDILRLKPYLVERDVRNHLRDTTEARKVLDEMGTPPLTAMTGVSKLLETAQKGGMLLPAELEQIGIMLAGIKRLKDFLNRAKSLEVGLGYYGDNLEPLLPLREEIVRSIRGNFVDDYASNELRDIRRSIANMEDKIKQKADGMLRNNKECYSDSFISKRNGHICLPVKKEYKFRVDGSVIDKSSTGATLFIEPTSIARLNEELQLLKLEEENEERKILYTLTALVAEEKVTMERNIKEASRLDFIFAKGKLSAEENGIAAKINTERFISIKNGRHPLLPAESCVPLSFQMGGKVSGVIITGPNTGGKTVAIKTVGLLSLMIQSGLHIPCEEANICMNSQVLCDIGDGQNITENLSTFSAHITNIMKILKRVNEESLVILDELGSGTDPAEGMGIAIAILEELKKSGCLFIATTHYPEIKTYAEEKTGILNARMAFDKETLRPLYRLEIGKAGESCALHIARKLGMPEHMILCAEKAAYGAKEKRNNIPAQADSIAKVAGSGVSSESKARKFDENIVTAKSSMESAPRIQKQKMPKQINRPAERFQLGDSVLVYPERKIGIVCGKVSGRGEVPIQLKNKKILVNHKRLKIHVKAEELYPEDYDFSIVFDSVENRKARHKMEKGHKEGLEIHISDVIERKK